MLTSWPALSTAFDGDWVIRLAEGHTKRANSITCLGKSASEIDERLERVQAIYGRHRLPTLFRISPLAPDALTDALDRRGWRCFEESIVMTADLASVPGSNPAGPANITVAADATPDWLDACARLDHLTVQTLHTKIAMLQRLVPQAGFGQLTIAGEIAALGLAVVNHDLVGLFEVMTAPAQRRRGFAKLLQTELFRWGRIRGGTTGWLAVVAENTPAKQLYEQLGFREVYRYHYRSSD